MDETSQEGERSSLPLNANHARLLKRPFNEGHYTIYEGSCEGALLTPSKVNDMYTAKMYYMKMIENFDRNFRCTQQN